MNNSPAPAIKLEINLDGPKCEAPPAALQLRLIPNKKSYTLEEISMKQDQASANRKKNLETLKLPSRIEMTRERRVSQEKAQLILKDFTGTLSLDSRVWAKMRLFTITCKLAAADERRAKRRANAIERARQHNQKVQDCNPQDDIHLKAERYEAKLAAAEGLRLKRAARVQERVSNHNKKVEERKQNDDTDAVEKAKMQVHLKLAAAEERRQKIVAEAQEKVINHNKKVQLRLQSDPEKVDSSKYEAKLHEAHQRREKLAQEIQQRVSEHNKKVMDHKRAFSVEKCEAMKKRCLLIESKQASAQKQRAERLDHVREKGVQFGLKKLSISASPKKKSDKDI